MKGTLAAIEEAARRREREARGEDRMREGATTTTDDEGGGRARRVSDDEASRSIATPRRKRAKTDARSEDDRGEEEDEEDSDDAVVHVMGGVGRITAKTMLDSSDAWRARDWNALRATFDRDGYLLIRGMLPREDVLAARAAALRALAEERPECFATDDEEEEEEEGDASWRDGGGGVLREGAADLGLLSRQHVAALPAIRAVTESDALFDLAEGVLQCERVMTTAYKWLRAVAGGEFTGVHTDKVFLGRGTSRLITTWIPFGAVKTEDGALLVAAGSHVSSDFERVRETYGTSTVGGDGTVSGWLTNDASEVPRILTRRDRGDGGDGEGTPPPPPVVDWRTTDFEPGDVCALGIETTHMSAANVSNVRGSGRARVRVSCDARWQPIGEAFPRDPRVRDWRGRGGVAVDE